MSGQPTGDWLGSAVSWEIQWGWALESTVAHNSASALSGLQKPQLQFGTMPHNFEKVGMGATMVSPGREREKERQKLNTQIEGLHKSESNSCR